MIYEIFLALIVIGSLILVISGNRKPYISIFWILFIVLLPGVGTIFYLLLGKDYRSRRVIKADELARFDALRDKAVGDSIIDSLPNDKYTKLASMMRHANDTPVLGNNNVRIFTDFTPMFQSMLDDISRAKNFVHIQFYIVDNDEVGHQLSSLECQPHARDAARACPGRLNE